MYVQVHIHACTELGEPEGTRLCGRIRYIGMILKEILKEIGREIP
jgi:hypothetical protein